MGSWTCWNTSQSDCLGSDQILEANEIKSMVHDQIAQLDERSRLSIELYYFEKSTLKEIGDRLGVTESRACQIRTAAISQVRRRVQRALRR